MPNSFRLFAGIFFFLTFGAPACSAPGNTEIAPGSLAPSFSLPALAGGKVDLEQYRGSLVLINFWGSWCGPCIGELPALERLYSRFKDKGFVVVGVGVDDQPSDLDQIRRRFGLSFPLVVDNAGEVKQSYGIRGVPESFLIDKAGKFVLLPDPDDGMPAMKIVGPRSWDGGAMVTILNQMLVD